MRQTLAASDPKDDYLQGRLAHAHADLGNAYAVLPRTIEALDHLHQAVKLTKSRSLADVYVRLDLTEYLSNLATAETKAGRPAEACDHLKEAWRFVSTIPEAAVPGEQAQRREVADAVKAQLATCRTSP